MQLTLKNGSKYNIKNFEIRHLPKEDRYFLLCYTEDEYKTVYKERSTDSSVFDRIIVDRKVYDLTGQKFIGLERETLVDYGPCIILSIVKE